MAASTDNLIEGFNDLEEDPILTSKETTAAGGKNSKENPTAVSSDNHSKSSSDDEEPEMPSDTKAEAKQPKEENKDEEEEDQDKTTRRSSRRSRKAKSEAKNKISNDDDDEEEEDEDEYKYEYKEEDVDDEDSDATEEEPKHRRRRNSISKPAASTRPSRRAAKDAAQKLSKCHDNSDNEEEEEAVEEELVVQDKVKVELEEAAGDEASEKQSDADANSEKEDVDMEEEPENKDGEPKEDLAVSDGDVDYGEESDVEMEDSTPKKRKSTKSTKSVAVKTETPEKAPKRGKKRKQVTLDDDDANVKKKAVASKDADGKVKIEVVKTEEASIKKEDNSPPKKKRRITEKNLEHAAAKMLEVLIENYKDDIKEMPLDVLASSTVGMNGKTYTSHRSDAIQEGLKLLKSRNQAEKIKGAGNIGLARLMAPEITKIPKEEISKDPAKALKQRFDMFMKSLGNHKKGGTGEKVVSAAKIVWEKLLDGQAYSSKELVAETKYAGTNSAGFEAIMIVLKNKKFVANQGKAKFAFTDKVLPNGRP